jgi:Domain of unknown function (DUF4124)
MAVLLPAVMLTAALAATPGGAATSAVFKCAGATGSVVYQDAPCAPGTELRNFATDPPALSVIPGIPVAGATTAPHAVAKPVRVTSSSRSRTTAGNTTNANERRFIQVGMSTAEVVQRIGKPDVDARNLRGKGQRWSYLPKDGDLNTMTTVTLVGGRVTDVERKVVR